MFTPFTLTAGQLKSIHSQIEIDHDLMGAPCGVLISERAHAYMYRPGCLPGVPSVCVCVCVLTCTGQSHTPASLYRFINK